MRKGRLIGYLLAISILASLLGPVAGTGRALCSSPVAAETEHVYEVVVGPPKVFKHGEYDLVKLPWCSFTQAKGRPLLPIQVYFVLDPPGGIESLIVEPLEWKELSGTYNIPPASPPISNKTATVVPDPEVYSSSEPYPGVLFRLSERPHVWRGLRYRVLVLYPLQYVPAEKKLIFYEAFKIRIRYGPMGASKPIFRPVEPIFTGAVLPRVVNPDILSSCWVVESNASITYLIITREIFLDELQPFVELKEDLHHESVAITTVEWIARHCSGRDLPEKIRNYIRDMYEEHGIWYVLLFGDVDPTDIITHYELDQEWEVPTRYVYNPDMEYDEDTDTWMDPDAPILDDAFGPGAPLWLGNFTPTDLYYACLDGNWDDDGDRIFGEIEFYSDARVEEVDWAPDVYVGRIPVKTEDEATDVIQKLCNYFGAMGGRPRARHKYFLLLGAIMDEYTDAKDVKEYVKGYSEIDTVELYESGGGDGPLKYRDVIDAINEHNPILINCFSHGRINELVLSGGSKYMDEDALDELSGTTGFFIVAHSCFTGIFDLSSGLHATYTRCLGEELLLHPELGSAVAFIGFNRASWYKQGPECSCTLSGLHDILLWFYFFLLYDPHAEACGYVVPGMLLHETTRICAECEYEANKEDLFFFLATIERERYRKNYFSATLLGDPSLRIFGVHSVMDKLAKGIIKRLESIEVSGHRFIPHVRVDIYLRYPDPYTYAFKLVKLGSTMADEHGRVKAAVAIPESAPLGQADVILIDEYGNFAVAGHITVVSGEEQPPQPPSEAGGDADGDLWPDDLDPWPDNPWLPNLAIATIGVGIVATIALLLLRRKP